MGAWELTGTPGAGVPAALVAACALVGADVGRAPEVRTRLPGLRWWAGREDQDPPGVLVVGAETDAGMLFGSGLDSTLIEPELTARVAEAVQDHLTGYESITWPTCPGHHHPMRPAAADGTASWCCPTSERPITPIGHWTPTP